MKISLVHTNGKKECNAKVQQCDRLSSCCFNASVADSVYF
jgi:hypothetical protein